MAKKTLLLVASNQVPLNLRYKTFFFNFWKMQKVNLHPWTTFLMERFFKDT